MSGSRGGPWRLGLRDGKFFDAQPDPADVPTELLELVAAKMIELCARWGELYPSNPVHTAEVDDG